MLIMGIRGCWTVKHLTFMDLWYQICYLMSMKFYVVLKNTSVLLDADENFRPLKPATSKKKTQKPLTTKPKRRIFEP